MRLLGVFAQSYLPIRFVVGIIAFKPDNFAVAFKRQNMRRDAVEEPAIMADDDGASGEVF